MENKEQTVWAKLFLNVTADGTRLQYRG